MAIGFNASSESYDHLGISSLVLSNSSDFTIMNWAYRSDVGSLQPEFYLINLWPVANVFYYFCGMEYNTFDLNFRIRNGDGDTGWLGGLSGTPHNAWTHIAMTRNGNNYYLYQNGELANSAINVTYNITTNRMGLGGYGVAGATALCKVGSSKAWQRALSLSEIQAEMYYAAAQSSTNLYDEWWFKNGDANRFNGKVNGHNWTENVLTTDQSDPPLVTYPSEGASPRRRYFIIN